MFEFVYVFILNDSTEICENCKVSEIFEKRLNKNLSQHFFLQVSVSSQLLKCLEFLSYGKRESEEMNEKTEHLFSPI